MFYRGFLFCSSSASPEHRRQYNGDAEVYEAAEPEYGLDPDIVLGTCKALYDFAGSSKFSFCWIFSLRDTYCKID